VLRWIMKKARAFTQKSMPSSVPEEKTLPEPSVTFSVETLKELLQTLSRVQVVKEHCETPESALAIIRDAESRKGKLKSAIATLLKSSDFTHFLKTRPLSAMKWKTHNGYKLYQLEYSGVVFYITLLPEEFLPYGNSKENRVQVEVKLVNSDDAYMYVTLPDPKLYTMLLAGYQCSKN
jgi:hypothetical protein